MHNLGDYLESSMCSNFIEAVIRMLAKFPRENTAIRKDLTKISMCLPSKEVGKLCEYLVDNLKKMVANAAGGLKQSASLHLLVTTH